VKYKPISITKNGIYPTTFFTPTVIQQLKKAGMIVNVPVPDPIIIQPTREVCEGLYPPEINVPSFFVDAYPYNFNGQNVETDATWMNRIGAAKTPVTSNVIITWDYWGTATMELVQALVDAHRKFGLHYALDLFHSTQSWGDPGVIDGFVAQAKDHIARKLLPGIGESFNFYIDAEFSLTWTGWDQCIEAVPFFVEVINRIAELCGNSKMVFIWSPYCHVINFDPILAGARYAGFMDAIRKYTPFDKGDITLVSAIQDGVGCSGQPNYVAQNHGDRTPGTPDYEKLLKLLDAHKRAVESDRCIGRVNTELFRFNPVTQNWAFGFWDRISQQFKNESPYSSQGIGPAFVLTKGSMGDYDNSEFEANYGH